MIYFLIGCLLGKGGDTAAPDGVYRAPRHRDLPDRWGHVARAEGEEGCADGRHSDWRVCALLDPLLHHRAHRPAVFLRHPTYLEEHLLVAGLLQLLL